MGSRTGFTDRRERAEDPPRAKSAIREWAETILIVLLFLLFLRAFVVQQSEIPSGSMEDTLLIGDHVLVNRFLYAPTSFAWERAILPIRDLRRGDVIVFKHPPGPETDFIKRVVGLPGETVTLRNGHLYVDGKPIREPFVPDEYRTRDDRRSFGPVTVPADQYFVLGDHRNASKDSRYWGHVPRDLVKGRAFMVLFSTDGSRPAGEPPGRVSPRSLLRKLYNLVFNLRWSRTFDLIR